MPPRILANTSDRTKTPAASKSALTGLKAAIGLIDDVDSALSAHQTIIAVPAAQGF
jgi:hypothetical protein